jgi:hypothetical protein
MGQNLLPFGKIKAMGNFFTGGASASWENHLNGSKWWIVRHAMFTGRLSYSHKSSLFCCEQKGVPWISWISGWWFQTWFLFSISYIGCNPSH